MILLGHHINEYTDHRNLVYDNFTKEKVLCWRLLLEEYAPTIKYIKGYDNVTVDTLIMLPIINSYVKDSSITREYSAEICCVQKLDSNTFSLTYQTIDKYHRK